MTGKNDKIKNVRPFLTDHSKYGIFDVLDY